MSGEYEGRILASGLRKKLRLGDAPIKDLFEFAHTAVGIDVLSMSAGGDEHGLSMLDPQTGRSVIAVAVTPHPMRQRSSIAHELGHVLAGDLQSSESWIPGERSLPEVRADAFARHLLLPDSVVRRRTQSQPATVERLSDLVQEFGVSPHVAAIRLRTVGAIDAVTCDAWSKLTARRLATQFGWVSQYRAMSLESEQERAPQRLMARAVEAFREGKLGFAELALWYGMDAASLAADEEFLNSAPAERSLEPDDDWDSDASLFPRPGGDAAP